MVHPDGCSQRQVIGGIDYYVPESFDYIAAEDLKTIASIPWFTLLAVLADAEQYWGDRELFLGRLILLGRQCQCFAFLGSARYHLPGCIWLDIGLERQCSRIGRITESNLVDVVCASTKYMAWTYIACRRLSSSPYRYGWGFCLLWPLAARYDLRTDCQVSFRYDSSRARRWAIGWAYDKTKYRELLGMTHMNMYRYKSVNNTSVRRSNMMTVLWRLSEIS